MHHLIRALMNLRYDGGIRVVFLPSNVTALCQPMDRGVLQMLKRRYRRRFLKSLLLLSCPKKCRVRKKESKKLVSLLENIPGCGCVSEEAITEWMESDEVHEMTDDDNVEMVVQEEIPEEEEEITENLIPHSEGFKMIEAALEYKSQQEEATLADVIYLCKWRDIASRKRAEKQKQFSIKDFFSK
ncbi:uncharacterized protein LOC129216585 [Uloborus diversus]|uniref:uncharacterized protein LOC129216585 n=1 Tax=Uloborus diversus TaxID=327109 RepID=UPI0024090C41|nr:uncharacterized protein LOC129216585 [Uloborus diversus]